MQESIDYDTYQLSFGEEFRCVSISLLGAVLVAWLLYKSLWGMFWGCVIFLLYRKHYKKEAVLKRKKELLLQFKDGMQSVSVAIMSGYSIENAWIEGEKELTEMYGKDAYMTEEMRQMNRGVKMNRTMEQQLLMFAERAHCEEITEFAEVFLFAKRNGGDFGKIIYNTAARIGERMDVERYIDTIIAGKKMEQRIMNIVPIGLLAYLNLTSAEFLAPLYGNLFGVSVMTVVFFIYLSALYMAQKLIDIKV